MTHFKAELPTKFKACISPCV